MYNPMLEYQRNQLLAQQASIQSQLAQMNQMNQMGQYQVQQTQPQFFVRQVGNIEEAKGFPVDPMSTFLFVDTGSGHIYLKRLNPSNGKSDFFVYGVVEDKPAADPMAQINERLARIEEIIGGRNDKPVPVDAEPDGRNAKRTAGENARAEPADVPESPADDKRKK